ncbi:hypothetical protein JQ554_22750 [Bradyrhizobium diazoefficiens]|nr:hypothetical protein [Bradyrhizobium diazoefficiens]MBR0966869.1 hypothetical protein [Bradyrhizobium diazoefficiens]MBR0980507.1 hypothetical protein [Bradyrhizobium diazoefficiens]MBR1009855.1 hypothetical protein [Bradyrhizobium diazoefficiens]MBR1016438.1 hypothetical protein [Bradyrhizobium diazoefficiens]MBR1053693.1 hypothetical protein [Bradyrhizobium diazoefficiens]
MTRSIAWAIVVALAAGLPYASASHSVTKLPDAAAGRAVFDARRHARYDALRYSPRPDPHYYARPVHYRPYPYAWPAPFVFGFAPRW